MLQEIQKINLNSNKKLATILTYPEINRYLQNFLFNGRKTF